MIETIEITALNRVMLTASGVLLNVLAETLVTNRFRRNEANNAIPLFNFPFQFI